MTGVPETSVIETSALTKRYRRVTALGDCTVSVPEGRISALVGPNGAGKTTLLRLLAGLAAPTAGRAAVLGGPPRQDPSYLAEIGFLAQEIPLYRRLTAQDHIGIGAHLNPRWDDESVRDRLGDLKIPLDRRVGTLPGGQRAQVALALTLAKRPRLLLLDEPLAALDPLARRNFLAMLAEAAAGGGLTTLLSSHLIADIERVCDHLILLAASRVQLCGDIETVLAEHRVLTGPRKDTTAIARTHVIVREDTTARQTTLLVKLNGPVIDPAWAVEEPNLEEIVLGYMGQDDGLPQPGLLTNGPLPALTTLTLAVPVLFGMFWGAPAVARERETGTVQFAWTQSVTRRRWLAVKTGWLLLAGAAFGGAVAGIVTWWDGPLNALNPQQFTPGKFDIQGIVPIGYAVFAVALGIAAGTLIGRSLTAIAVTGGVFVAIRLVITYLVRVHYMPAVTTIYSVTQNLPSKGANWPLAQGVVLPDGQFSTSLTVGPGSIMGFGPIPVPCSQAESQISATLTCMARLGYRSFATYQPGYRFWPFQFIETGIFVALAGALIAITFLVVRKRDA